MIYLIRHTRPDVAAGICYGQSDVALADTCPVDFAMMKSRLHFPPNAIVMSSPLQRCVKLAAYLFDKSKVVLDDRLLEMDFGEWEMQPWDTVDPVILAQWGNNFVSTSSPDGESLTSMSHRVMSLWNSLDHLNKNYVLFTHAGVIRVILAHLLESPLHKAFTLDVEYGDAVRIQYIDEDNCTVRFV